MRWFKPQKSDRCSFNDIVNQLAVAKLAKSSRLLALAFEMVNVSLTVFRLPRPLKEFNILWAGSLLPIVIKPLMATKLCKPDKSVMASDPYNVKPPASVNADNPAKD